MEEKIEKFLEKCQDHLENVIEPGYSTMTLYYINHILAALKKKDKKTVEKIQEFMDKNRSKLEASSPAEYVKKNLQEIDDRLERLLHPEAVSPTSGTNLNHYLDFILEQPL